jgi:putative ABC transport system permease protein
MVSLLGVTFAVLLIFMQLGFRGAVANTATVVYGRMQFDILVQSREYLHLYEARSFERRWLDLIAEYPDVESVDPFWIMLQKWQSPSDNNFRGISMMAMPPGKSIFDVPEIESQLDKLRGTNNILIDRDTRKTYGPVDGEEFGDADVEQARTTELGGKNVIIRGHFFLGTGLATNGAVLISDTGFDQRAPFSVRDSASLGLIHLRDGVDVDSAAESIREYLREIDPEVENVISILPRQAVIDKETHRWLAETPIGIIFQMGVGLAFVVGSVIVYMVLSQDVSNRLSEYATLKAMGYSPWFVALVVLRQAWLLSVGGLILAILGSFGLYYLTSISADIPIRMTNERLIGVSALAIIMCTLSGLAAIRTLWKAEPASLF